MHFRTPLTVSYSNLANNLFASSCDNLRPMGATSLRLRRKAISKSSSSALYLSLSLVPG
jgi:hypothetical protein